MVRNHIRALELLNIVVNCFQIFLSSWWFATWTNLEASIEPLWIAFKFFYLRDGSQPMVKTAFRHCSCELLSNFSIFVMVRNCSLPFAFTCPLWIAFKFFYLRDGSQLVPDTVDVFFRCELLSNFSIFVMVRNIEVKAFDANGVVNCFQIFLSSWWFATALSREKEYRMLWIAFKFFYLRDGSQLYGRSRDQEGSCELLSNFSIFVMVRNILLEMADTLIVVNCFQIFLSSWWFATKLFFLSLRRQLWIAFKFFYLRDGSQRIDWRGSVRRGCELLSNFSIFVMVRNTVYEEEVI